MKKPRLLFLLGIFLIILPILGFPSPWKNFFIVLIGVLLVFNSYMMRRNYKKNTWHVFGKNQEETK